MATQEKGHAWQGTAGTAQGRDAVCLRGPLARQLGKRRVTAEQQSRAAAAITCSESGEKVRRRTSMA